MTREELNQQKQNEIIREEKNEKRKKLIIFGFKASLIFVGCFLMFYFYTTYVSTSMMIVKEYRSIDEKVPTDFNGLKIIQFSDLHYGTTFFEKQLKNMVNEINSRNPDLVFFTGDLIDKNYKVSDTEKEMISKHLRNIKASLGKYAVSGEEDSDSFITILNQSNFTILNNDYDMIYNNSSTPILLVGLSSLLSNTQNIDNGFSYFNTDGYNADIYTITLVHEPDSIDGWMRKYNSNLVFAGHSHNGNIRLPFFGAISKVDGAKKYDQEYYKIKNSELFISSGMGTNGPGFRLFCRPSFNFVRVSNK